MKRKINNKDKEKLKMMNDNRVNAPVISPDINIRGIIDESQFPIEKFEMLVTSLKSSSNGERN